MDAKYYEEAFKYLGIDAEDMETFKEKFSEKYVSDERSAVEKFLSPAIGKKIGSVKTKLLKEAREEGIEFTHTEFEKAELEDVVKTLNERRMARVGTELDELKKKALTSGSNDEVIKEWEDKYKKAATRASEYENSVKTIQGEYEKYKAESANAIKSVKIDYFKTDAHSKLKFKPTVTEMERQGFDTHMKNNYRLDFDDTGKIITTNANGERIKSEKQAGVYKEYDEIVIEEASKYKLIAENPQAGKPVFTTQTTGHPAPVTAPIFQAQPEQPAVRTHPGYRKPAAQ